ncbi:hypothetical protein [Adlercreutzia sp. ZJ473]|uniref:hypothetical protein n=1 Tax=Adlercreutzia sp. ZJ473 TaxID=2722822 RepID=UPI0015571013|nr:hypothetical protein [Adlercreutzia sp. ZJ473]
MFPSNKASLLAEYLRGAFGTTYIGNWSRYGISREDVSHEEWPSENYFPNKIRGDSPIDGKCASRVRTISEAAIRSKGSERFTLSAFSSNCSALLSSWYGEEAADLAQIREHANTSNPEIRSIIETFWLSVLDGICAQLSLEGAEWSDVISPRLSQGLETLEASLARFGGSAEAIEVLKNHLANIEKNSGTYYLDSVSRELFPDLRSDIETRQYSSRGSDYPSVWSFLFDDGGFKRNRHAMLVGEGGIGKTVSVQTAARTALSEGYLSALIPLNVFTWRAVEGGNCLANYIREIAFRNAENCWEAFLAQCDDEHAEKPAFLFLDGWNEISSATNNASLYIQKELEDQWMHYPNLTIVITGREQADKVSFWSKKLEYIEALPLEKANIRKYLEDHQAPVPADSSNMWETLANPLMITLYTNTLKQQSYIGDPRGLRFIAEEPNISTQAAIIWNFIQCQIAKFSQDARLTPLDISTALIYASSVIGAAMKQSGRFEMTRGEAANLLQSQPEGRIDSWFDSDYCLSRPADITQAPHWDYRAYLHILCDQTKILHEVELGDGEISFAFMHQKFRDFFDAVCMRVSLRPYSTNADPSTSQQWSLEAKETETLNLLAPLFTKRELDEAWARCSSRRLNGNEDDYSAFHMLELYRRLNVDFGSLDYTGKDLRSVHFYTYGCDLRGCRFDSAVIGSDTFASAASNEHVDLISFLGASGASPMFATASESAVFVWNSLTGSILGYRKLTEDEGSIQQLVPYGDADLIGFVTTSRVFTIDTKGRTTEEYGGAEIVSSIPVPSSCLRMMIGGSSLDIIPGQAKSRLAGLHAELESGGAFAKHRMFHLGSSDATELFSFTSDTLHKWKIDWSEGKVEQCWKHTFQSTVTTAHFDTNHPEVLCLLSKRNNVVRYNYQTNAEESLFGIGQHPFGAAFSPTGRYLAVGLEDEIRIYDSFSGRLVDSFNQELLTDASAALVQAFAFSSDESYLLCSHATDAVSIWDLTQANYLGAKKPLKVLFGSDAELLSHIESLGGRLLLMTSKGLVYWFNPNAGRIDECGDFELEDCRIEAFAISPDGSRLLLATDDLDLHLYSISKDGFTPLSSVKCLYSPDRIRYSTDLRIIFVSTERDNILAFDADDLTLLYEGDLSELLPDAIRPESICPIPQSQLLVADLGNTVHTIRYQVEDSRLTFVGVVASNEVWHECTTIDASLPNNRIVCMGPFDTITAFDESFSFDVAHNLVDDDQRIFDAVQNLNLEVTFSAMSPSSRYYAYTLDTSHPGGTYAIVIADLDDFTCKAIEFEADKAHTATVDSLQFSHDDARLFARYGEDGLGTIDVKSGKIAYSQVLPSIRVFKASFRNAVFEDADTPNILEENGAVIDEQPNVLASR